MRKASGCMNRGSLTHQRIAKHAERILAFAGGHGNSDAGRNLAVAIQIIFTHWFFKPENILILDLPGESDGLVRSECLIGIHHQPNPAANLISDGAHPFDIAS